jgi:hypothetical protein
MALRHATLTGSHVGRANVVLKRRRDAAGTVTNYMRNVPVCMHRRLHQRARRGLSTTLYLPAPPTSRSRQDSVLVFLATFVSVQLLFTRFDNVAHTFVSALHRPSPAHPADSLFTLPLPPSHVPDRYCGRLQYRLPPAPPLSSAPISPFFLDLETLTVLRTVDSCSAHVRLDPQSTLFIPRHCHAFTVTTIPVHNVKSIALHRPAIRRSTRITRFFPSSTLSHF